MRIRAEKPADYAAVASVHAAAFGRSAEAAVLALRRCGREYDPQLSLLAEESGRILGHVLLAPCSIQLLGQRVRAVQLAPIGVHPGRQHEGIGSALIEAAHAAARAKGYAVSFLLGDPGFYARFGYRPGAFGAAYLETEYTHQPAARLHRRALAAQDLPALRAIWKCEEGAVDFAIDPGDDPLEWLSPHPAIEASVFTTAGEVVGYTRVHGGEPAAPRAFLAKDDRAAVAIAGVLAQAAGAARLTLPLHPRSRSAKAFPAAARCEAWESGMACALAPSPLDDYLAQVATGKRIPGRPIWPVAFDLA